ncbi:MAG: hypothetical protein IPK26_15205 [Planctomycetes bacterium]|nr:hypothetical protein [Planctomycetota bacterium]
MKPIVLVSLFVLGTLGAQTFVSPATHGHSEGGAQNSFPFGTTIVPFRYLQIHDDVPAMTISGLAFRHNATNTVYPAHSVTLDAWVSTAAFPSVLANATFDLNHGGDKIQVVTNRTYNLPASDPHRLPGEFVLDFPFDVPFVYAGGSLCWEVQVTAKTQAANIFYDAMTGGGTSPALATSRGLAGCRSTGRTLTMTVNPTGPTDWTTGTGSLNIAGSQLQANGAVFHVLGFDTAFWTAVGVPLPAMIPTSDTAPSGTCTIYLDVLYVAPFTASATGTVSIQLPVPVNVGLVGLTAFSQIIGLDAAANPFGMTASQMAMHNWVGPFPAPSCSRVSSSGSLGPTGGINVGVNTLITKFY